MGRQSWKSSTSGGVRRSSVKSSISGLGSKGKKLGTKFSNQVWSSKEDEMKQEEVFKERVLEDCGKVSPASGWGARVVIIFSLVVCGIFYYFCLLGGVQLIGRWFNQSWTTVQTGRRVVLLVFYPIFALRLCVTLIVSNIRRKTIWSEYVTLYVILMGFIAFHAVYGAVCPLPLVAIDYVGIIIFIIGNCVTGYYEHLQLGRSSLFGYPLKTLLAYHSILTGWCFLSRGVFMFWWPIFLMALFLLVTGSGRDKTAMCANEECSVLIVGQGIKFNFCRNCRDAARERITGAKLASVLPGIGGGSGGGGPDVVAGGKMSEAFSFSLDDSNSPSTDLCGSCNLPVDKHYVVGMGRKWHAEHFCCSHCDRPFLGDRYYEKDGSPFCAQHYQELFCPKCAGCKQPVLEGGEARAMGMVFHPRCFKCAKCGNPITDEFTQNHGKAFCLGCN